MIIFTFELLFSQFKRARGLCVMEIDLYRCKLRKCRLVKEESNVQARVKHDKYLTVHTSNQSHFSSAFIAPINLM